MEIAYAAHTESCTLLLDAEGYCRKVVLRRGIAADPGAQRILGAQYVAAIDLAAFGGLVQMPKPGTPMLFALVSRETGKIVVVRTAPVVRFESKVKPDSGVRARPQRSVVDDDEKTIPVTEEERRSWRPAQVSRVTLPPPPPSPLSRVTKVPPPPRPPSRIAPPPASSAPTLRRPRIAAVPVVREEISVEIEVESSVSQEPPTLRRGMLPKTARAR